MRAGIDREDGDAVVAAIRSIKKLAVRMHFQLSRIIRSGKVLRQRRDGLQGLQLAGAPVISECRDEGPHLTERVGELPVGMEGKVARTRALRHWREGRVARREVGFG